MDIPLELKQQAIRRLDMRDSQRKERYLGTLLFVSPSWSRTAEPFYWEHVKIGFADASPCQKAFFSTGGFVIPDSNSLVTRGWRYVRRLYFDVSRCDVAVAELLSTRQLPLLERIHVPPVGKFLKQSVFQAFFNLNRPRIRQLYVEPHEFAGLGELIKFMDALFLLKPSALRRLQVDDGCITLNRFSDIFEGLPLLEELSVTGFHVNSVEDLLAPRMGKLNDSASSRRSPFPLKTFMIQTFTIQDFVPDYDINLEDKNAGFGNVAAYLAHRGQRLDSWKFSNLETLKCGPLGCYFRSWRTVIDSAMYCETLLLSASLAQLRRLEVADLYPKHAELIVTHMPNLECIKVSLPPFDRSGLGAQTVSTVRILLTGMQRLCEFDLAYRPYNSLTASGLEGIDEIFRPIVPASGNDTGTQPCSPFACGQYLRRLGLRVGLKSPGVVVGLSALFPNLEVLWVNFYDLRSLKKNIDVATANEPGLQGLAFSSVYSLAIGVWDKHYGRDTKAMMALLSMFPVVKIVYLTDSQEWLADDLKEAFPDIMFKRHRPDTDKDKW